jgi:hypothetical protein
VQERVQGLKAFLCLVLEEMGSLQERNRKLLCEFLDVKTLYDPPTKIVHAEVGDLIIVLDFPQ